MKDNERDAQSSRMDFNDLIAQLSSNKISQDQMKDLLIQVSQCGDLDSLRKLIPIQSYNIANSLSDPPL